jgi:pimeloyl-ACP methyl ester carboxylesterase
MNRIDPTTTLRTSTFERRGILQRYHLAGSGPYCIVHSGGPGIDWRYMRMFELEAYFTLVYIEPIGSPGAAKLPSHPHGYDVSTYADQIDAVLDDLRCGSAVILGHSHGGFVAQRFALQYGERIDALLLYDTAPTSGMDLFAAASESMESFRTRHSANDEAVDVLKAWSEVATVHDDASYTEVLRRLFPAYFADYWALVNRLAIVRAQISATHVIGGGTPFDSRAALDQIVAPSLVLAGDFDFICGPRWAEELHRGISGSTLVLFENSGHFAHLEEPSEFVAAVTTFARRYGIL